MLKTRVWRLEKVAGARPGAACPGCGLPAGYGPGLRLEDRSGQPTGPRCGVCGCWLDARGRAIVPVPLRLSPAKVLVLDEGAYELV